MWNFNVRECQIETKRTIKGQKKKKKMKSQKLKNWNIKGQNEDIRACANYS